MTYTTATNSRGKAFPSPLDKSERGANAPEPTMLGRRDLAHSRWTVEDCRPVRGEPSTDLEKRIMFAPATSDELARVIRSHEMMHAKVSPSPEQWEAFVNRAIASDTALTVCEEMRVNFLCQQQGFDVKNLLADGSELATGETVAKTNDWPGAVAMCIATAGTVGHKAFLTGVRRHNRAWGDALLTIGKRAMKEIRKSAKSGTLASTDVHEGIAPFGFTHTERLAEWVDRLASFPPPKERTAPSAKKGKEGKSTTGLDKSEATDDEHSAEYDKNGEGEGDRKGEPHGRVKPAEYGGATSWAELVVSREPLPRYHTGSLGKKRVATNMGRRPRRLQRLMTDPAKRVFDKTVRGSGGMVVIDASGSMSFTTEQIAQIIENAPGATVLIYSDRYRKTGEPNAWVVADKGRMVENVEYIDYGHGNGVDFPAIEWGVKNRQYKNTPLVWVTDGGVCGASDGMSDLLTMQCVNYTLQHGYIVVPHIEEAIEQLSRLRKGEKARSVWPWPFVQAYQQHMGVTLSE